MDNEKIIVIKWVKDYLLWCSIAILLILLTVMALPKYHLLSDAVVIALISFLGVNVMGMVTIILKHLFK